MSKYTYYVYEYCSGKLGCLNLVKEISLFDFIYAHNPITLQYKFKDIIIADDPLTSVRYLCELSKIGENQVLIVDSSEKMCQGAKSVGFRVLHLSELIACYDAQCK